MSVTGLDGYESSAPPSEDFGRTPPQDVVAEQSVLGGMLLSKDAIADVVETIRGTDFYRPAHELIYDAILDLYGRGEPADAVTVAAELTTRGELGRVGGAPYLHTLISSVPTAANAGYYAQIVRDRAILRRLVEAGTRIVQLGYATDGGDVDALVDNAQAEVYAVTERRTSEDYVPLGDVIEGTIDEIEASGHQGDGMVGVPTGFADLDQLTNGLHPGQMIVLAARPAIGKSTLGLDIARSASIKHGMASVIFSLEMGRNEIAMRLLSAESTVSLQHMRKGTMREEDWTRLARTMGRVSEAPLFIDDSPNMSLMEIRAKCRRLKQRHDLKLVIIDYLQLMSSGKRVESRQQEVSEFSRALKLLAKELEVPVIAISQLNRGPEQRTDKKPAMSDLRESGCLTADTRVLRADTGAEVTLGELFAAGARDVPVWALDDGLRYVRRHLTHVFSTGTKPVFRLRLASGKEVRATANHPFLGFDGWTPLGELSPGARVAVPRHVPAPELVGSWSDAQVVRAARRVAAGVDDAFPVECFHLPKRQIALLVREVFSVSGRVVRPTPSHSGTALWRGRPSAVDGLSRLLLRFGISTVTRDVAPAGGEAPVPVAEGVRSLLAPQVAATSAGSLLREVRLGDADDRRRFFQEIGVHGVLEAAALDVLERAREETVTTPGHVASSEVWQQISTLLGAPIAPGPSAAHPVTSDPAMSGRGASDSVASSAAGSGLAVLPQIARRLDDADLDVHAVNDVLWDVVESIVPDGVEEVFDATVLGTHNFVANGIAVHNSIEQDADMVILLHREDAYDRESPRAGEADFIVAKHRNGPTDTIVVAFQGHYSRFVDMAQGG